MPASSSDASVPLAEVVRTASSGDVLLFRARRGVRRLLMDYTHAGIVVGPRVVEAHATGDGSALGNPHSGVFAYDLARRVRTYDGTVYLARLRARPNAPGDIERVAAEFERAPYDARHASWVVGACTLGLPLKRRPGAVFCSELVVKILQRVGIVGSNVRASCTRPDQLLDLGMFGPPERITG